MGVRVTDNEHSYCTGITLQLYNMLLALTHGGIWRKGEVISEVNLAFSHNIEADRLSSGVLCHNRWRIQRRYANSCMCKCVGGVPIIMSRTMNMLYM